MKPTNAPALRKTAAASARLARDRTGEPLRNERKPPLPTGDRRFADWRGCYDADIRRGQR